MEPVVNLQVVGSQQVSLPQPVGPPQSHSSPSSTMPLPHSPAVMRVTFLLEVRQVLEVVLVRKPLQMLPMVQGEKRFVASIVVGFIYY
jgi:hypothetical protein